MDRLILGKDVEFSIDEKKTNLNNNICIIGTTGSGKTLSLIQPRLIYNRSMNLIVSDPKRELIEPYRNYYENLGYTVLELNVSDPLLTDVCCDPMEYVACHKDINALARAIVDLTPQRPNSSADSYWENSGCNVAKFAMYYKLAFDSSPSIVDVVEFIENLDVDERNSLMTTNVDYIVEDVKSKEPNHPMIASYNSFKTAPIKTAGSIFTTIKTTLSNVFSEDIKDVIKKNPTLDLEKFTKEKSILFITADGADEYEDAFINLIFDTLIQQLTKIANTYPDKKLPIPVHLIFDDFAAGTKISSFPKQISKFRSKNISSTIVLQSETQLDGMFGEADGTTIINNNDTLVYLGGNDIKTTKNIAVRLNCPIEKVLYMPLDKICVFRRGSKPIITNKYETLKDKNFIKIQDNYKKSIIENGKHNTPSLLKNEIKCKKVYDSDKQKDLDAKFDKLYNAIKDD